MTASSLTSITDTPIPDASISAKVMIIAPQVQDLAALQASQLKTIASLKERTAAVLERFYSVDILQTGEYWADVETRVDRADHAIRRAALAQKQDDV